MAEVVGRSKILAAEGSAARLPVAHMVCNQTPPIGSKPSLMTFREVETLFHEMGHALGYGHSPLMTQDRHCNVMAQQTKGTGNCIPNGFPRNHGFR